MISVSESETPFLLAIHSALDDDLPRLLFSDWLSERGDPRGIFLRLSRATRSASLRIRIKAKKGLRWWLRKFEREWLGALLPMEKIEIANGLFRLNVEWSWLKGGGLTAKLSRSMKIGWVEAVTINESIDGSDTFRRHADAFSLVPRLRLNGTLITDRDAECLEDFTNLRQLELSQTRVTDFALGAIKQLANLRYLNIACTRVSDFGLAQIRTLGSLEDLDLSGTQVTDSGLPALKGFHRLKLVDLRRTRVTVSGKRLLARALPRCRIL